VHSTDASGRNGIRAVQLDEDEDVFSVSVGGGGGGEDLMLDLEKRQQDERGGWLETDDIEEF